MLRVLTKFAVQGAVAGLVALVLLAAAPSQAEAQACYRCIPCDKFGVPGHKFTGQLADPGERGLTDREHGGCEAPSCEECLDPNKPTGTIGCHEHLICEGSGLALRKANQVMLAVRSGDARAVARLVAASGGKLVVNRKRNAIQAVGCNQAIVAHIPLPAPVYASL